MSGYYHVIAYVDPSGNPESYVVRRPRSETAECKRSARAASDDFFSVDVGRPKTSAAPLLDTMFDSVVRGKGTFKPADVYIVLPSPMGRVAWDEHMNFLDNSPKEKIAFDAASLARQKGAKRLFVFGREIKL